MCQRSDRRSLLKIEDVKMNGNEEESSICIKDMIEMIQKWFLISGKKSCLSYF